MSKKKDTRIICSIFAFVQTLSMVLMIMTVLLYTSFLSYGSIIRNLNSINYYEDIKEYTLERIYDILIPTGLPNSITDDVFTLETYKFNVNGYIESTLNGTVFEFETTEIRDGLTRNINAFLESEGLYGYVEQSVIDEVIEAILESYISIAKLPFLSTIADYIGIYRQLLNYIVPACLVIIAFCAYMNFQINKWKHRFYRYQAYSCVATGLMITIIPLIIKVWGGYARIALQPDYINHFIVYQINALLQAFIIVGILLIISGVLIAWLSEKGRETLIKEIKSKYKKVDKVDNTSIVES